MAEVRRDGRVMTHCHFIEERRADHIDVICGHDATCEQVDGIGPIGLVKTLRVVAEVEFIPEVASGDAGVFQLGQSGCLGVDVVNGEKGGDAELFGFGGNQPGHPVVTMNDVRFNPGDDVVDEISLEGESRHEEVFLAGLVNTTAAIEFTILGEVNAVANRDAGAFSGVGGFFATLEKTAVMRDSEVNVLFGRAESVDEESRDIGEASSLGAQPFGIVGKLLGDVGYFRGNEENARSGIRGAFLARFLGHGGNEGLLGSLCLRLRWPMLGRSLIAS